MADPRIIIICHSGGAFEMDVDGSFFYRRSRDCRAIDITRTTEFEEFKRDICEIFDLASHSFSIEYLLPRSSNKIRNPISDNEDLQRMLRLQADSSTAEIFITMIDSPPLDLFTSMDYAIPDDELTPLDDDFFNDITIDYDLLNDFTVRDDLFNDMTLDDDLFNEIKALDDALFNDGSSASKLSETTVPEVLPPADSIMLDATVDDGDSDVHNYMGNAATHHVDDVPAMMPPHQEGGDIRVVQDNDDEIVDIGGDPVPSSDSEVVQYWKKSITKVGQRYNNVQEFRETLRRYAIAHKFSFRYLKSDSSRVTAKCKVKGCPWRIYASKVPGTRVISIKTMNLTHTCNGAASLTGHQANKNWVASNIIDKLKDSPEYKPKDIIDYIKQEYKFTISYFQAWRGRVVAKMQLLLEDDN